MGFGARLSVAIFNRSAFELRSVQASFSVRTLTRSSAIIATAALFLSTGGWAGGAPKAWQIQEIANAPILAVCTVRDVTARELVPPGITQWNGLGRYFEAKLFVNRVFRSPTRSASPQPQPNETITLRYISYEPRSSCCANGSPLWPRLKAGDVALFPLTPSGGSNSWNLLAEQGEDILVPALAAEWRTPDGPGSPRAFILHELANTLTRGNSAEQSRAASWLAGQREEPAEIRPMLEALLGSNDDKWLQTATALLQFVGFPGLSVTDLMAGRAPVGLLDKTVPSMAVWALKRGATRDYPNRLIPALIARGLYDPLREFRDSPVLDSEMTLALRRRAPESMLLALNFIRSGKTTFLGEALQAAAELAQKPASVPAENSSALTFACKLIIDYGNEPQLDAVATSLRQFQNADEDQYRSLWRAIDGSENKRALPLDAIVITDRRILSRDVRFCDTAAGDISRLSGEAFYAGSEASVAQRDEGIARAITWLKSNNLI